MYTAIDLFAGGGGLTVGLKKAGFKVVGAVEIDQHAIATYKANHPDVKALTRDIKEIKGEELIKLSPTGKIDLLTGCPPCQGFSTLTAKYKRNDPRNSLIEEMGRLMEEVRPRALMMENVPGMAKKGKPLLDIFLNKIIQLGYVPSYGVLETADYGVPQQRRRFVLLAGFGFKINLPEPTHSSSYKKGLNPWRTVREAISHMPEPIDLERANMSGGPSEFNWHIVRTLADVNKQRLKYIKPGKSWLEIPEKLRPKCHRGSYKGFPNVYGRLEWDKASGTITGGCTTLSKGRFGHPEKDRTISLREAALLQTFPSDYVFDTPFMGHACNIVGNALPCDFAEALSSKCIEAFS